MYRTEVDITPHPKVLTVLGEIEFKPIQCIAELIDNSIDGFLHLARAGKPIENPLVLVAFGRDTVVVKDNGPGMSIDALEMAIKAVHTRPKSDSQQSGTEVEVSINKILGQPVFLLNGKLHMRS